MDFAADLALFYDEFAVDATHTPNGGGAVTAGKVILDEPGQVVFGGEIVATEFSLRFPAATFPSVRRGDAFAIGSRNFTAREDAQPTLDGLERMVPLAKA